MPARSEHREDICILTIDRPERANSIDLETALELSAALDQLAEDEGTRVVVLTGAGDRVFCAGMDLKAVAAGLAEEINNVPGGFAGIVRRDFPKPIIAAVEGAAIGGGFEIVLACDMVVASEQAQFGLPEVGHGLIAASGGLIRLPKRIPPALAVELLLTGEPIGSGRAQELGLVNRVVPTGTALTGALELAALIAARDPAAVRASVTLARTVARGDEAAAWASCADLAADLAAEVRTRTPGAPR
ncbi:MAG: enoyl-CoA hydratase/isomerase family protein [Acidobacteriota bacterium]|nr:enoyl-CoA hydratase/isomerase family protein [Acidobacteriota bacterium]